MSRVVNIALTGTQRFASGYTPAILVTCLTANRSSSRPKLAQTSFSETFIPPLRKKNGVSRANATTRNLRVSSGYAWKMWASARPRTNAGRIARSEEHTSELQSRLHLVCRLLLEKKKNIEATELR